MNRGTKSRRAVSRHVTACVAFLMCVAGAVPLATAASYNLATVTFLEAPTSAQNCLYFELTGIAQADPIVPSVAWFAIPNTHNGFTQIYAMLLSIKLTGGTVNVVTTGALAGGTCGNYAGVASVVMN